MVSQLSDPHYHLETTVNYKHPLWKVKKLFVCCLCIGLFEYVKCFQRSSSKRKENTIQCETKHFSIWVKTFVLIYIDNERPASVHTCYNSLWNIMLISQTVHKCDTFGERQDAKRRRMWEREVAQEVTEVSVKAKRRNAHLDTLPLQPAGAVQQTFSAQCSS